MLIIFSEMEKSAWSEYK